MTTAVLVEREIDIEAPPDVVFELLTDARGLLEWMAVEAESEVVVGGLIRWRHENGDVMQGRFVEIERPTRVVFSYGWERGGLDIPRRAPGWRSSSKSATAEPGFASCTASCRPSSQTITAAAGTGSSESSPSDPPLANDSPRRLLWQRTPRSSSGSRASITR